MVGHVSFEHVFGVESGNIVEGSEFVGRLADEEIVDYFVDAAVCAAVLRKKILGVDVRVGLLHCQDGFLGGGVRRDAAVGVAWWRGRYVVSPPVDQHLREQGLIDVISGLKSFAVLERRLDRR